MLNKVIQVSGLSKQYRLGQVGTGSLSHDINRFWHRARGKENPYLKVGEENKRETKGNSDYLWALKDINFEIEQGERIGIIGRNGAGKSTLLKILSRTTSPTTGSVKIKGRVASLLEVGTGFHPDLTGRDNIFLNGAILGMSKIDIKNRLEMIVNFAGVERYIDTPVKRYSSGMYVRLAFAVAAHLESDILIVDEVLAVGDAEFQKKCLGKMSEMSKSEGRTVIFVSHNISAIKNLCTNGLLLQNGNIKFKGGIQECLSEYHNFDNKRSNLILNETTERLGNGKLRIINFSIKNQQTHFGNLIKSGSNVEFIIEYQNNNYPDIYTSTVASIALVDSQGQVVLLARTNFTNDNFEVNAIFGKLTCKIEDLAVSNGVYYVTAYLGFGETEIYDLVENICELKVAEGDYFGTGSNGLPSFCKTLTRAKWEINE